MSVDIEEILGRELHQVAHGLHVPAMPALPTEPSRQHRHWQALLVAAVIVLVVAAALAVEAVGGGSREPSPAPPSPTPSEILDPATIPTSASSTPYVLGTQLYVDGAHVPGQWWSVEHGETAWLAHRSDGTWWWGRDATARQIEGLSGVPVISPNGRYVAAVDEQRAVITGFETTAGSEGFGEVSVELGDPARTGDPVHVRAVTDDGHVIAQGAAASVLWLPLIDGSTVDLTVGGEPGSPELSVLGNTPAGLVVTDGAAGPPYLAEITSTGGVAGTGAVPEHDSLVVSPGGQWLAWTPEGTLGGEVTGIRALQVRRLDGTGRLTLDAPSGWAFRVQDWTWEDDGFLVAPAVAEDGTERLTRCGAEEGRCVLIGDAT